MRSFSRLVAVASLLALLAVPFGVFADQIAAPVEKKVQVGTSVVHYAGQSLRFTTPVALIVKLSPVSATEFRLVVSEYGANGPSAGYLVVEIYWEDFGSDVYTGPPPPESEPWDGVLNTESGFTEK
jgi:hypothetical protein